MTTANDTTIHSRALLVWLTISTWAARRYDKVITQRVNADYNASSDAGRYNKFLLPGDAPAYKQLLALAGSIRTAHYSNTLAWSDEGWRLLPVNNYMQYTSWIRQQQTAFDNALDQFLMDYPSLRSDAAVRLAGLYKSEDYPSTRDMRDRFSVQVKFQPVPAAGDIRVDLAADQIKLIEDSIADRIETATATAMSDAWSRLHTCVAHIADRLSDPEAIFRDSLIKNAREVCDSLKRLNITNDPNLESMRVRVENELVRHDPDVLRDTPRVRTATADKAADILRQMSGLYGASDRSAA